MAYRKEKPKQGSELEKFLVREQPYTYEDYAALPEDELLRYELADGKLELMSSPTPRHQLVILQIVIAVTQTCGKEYFLIQDVDLLISNTEVRRADLSIIHRSRKAIITNKGITEPPEVVVEILSPLTARTDKYSKAKSYTSFGIPEYWILDPLNGLLEKHVLDNNAYRLANLYMKDDCIDLEQLPCASFTLNELLSEAAELPND
ncbi:Uma2 family endonuclease [Paenibacillus cremeus]|uniref:Uma2 family endonuclease n=1 Tax=Paenibacillus cremeus TaxID=2163881 RepID=A0A559K3G5_9BACL|nr:Uma2 family endonuclease [Paenibacillus cremeus]TVY06685.1 Uma2 family endonuclease [Paenibacillus cremeus]